MSDPFAPAGAGEHPSSGHAVVPPPRTETGIETVSGARPVPGPRAPAATGPAATGPAATDPVSTRPGTSGPITTDPITTDPAMTDPATTEPVNPFAAPDSPAPAFHAAAGPYAGPPGAAPASAWPWPGPFAGPPATAAHAWWPGGTGYVARPAVPPAFFALPAPAGFAAPAAGFGAPAPWFGAPGAGFSGPAPAYGAPAFARVPAPAGLVPPRGPFPRELWPCAVVDPAADRRGRHSAAITVLALVFVMVALLGGGGAPGVAAGALPDLGGKAVPGPRGHEPRDGGDAPPVADEGPAETGTTADAVRTRATAILQTHDRAADGGDLAPALARIDPSASGVRATWQRLTANLRKVPFDDTRWRATGVTDIVPVDAQGGTYPLTAKVRVRFEHKITAHDHSAVVERYVWSVRCADPADACLVTAIEGGANTLREGPAGYPAPWDLWDLAVERRPHVLLMGPASGAASLRQWADVAERAAAYDLGAWRGSPGAPGFVLTLTRDRTAFGKLYTGEGSHDWAAGYSLGLPAASESGFLGAARIVVDLDALAANSRYARVLLRHEMAHALLEPLSRSGYDDAAMWMTEGFADWLAEADVPVARVDAAAHVSYLVSRGKFTGRLPGEAEFRTDDEDRVETAYNLGHTALRYLAEKYGAQVTCAFVENVYGGEQRGDVEAALRVAIGKDLATFEREWAAWVRTTFR